MKTETKAEARTGAGSGTRTGRNADGSRPLHGDIRQRQRIAAAAADVNDQFALDGRIRHARGITAVPVDNEVARDLERVGGAGTEAVAGGQVDGDVAGHALDG